MSNTIIMLFYAPRAEDTSHSETLAEFSQVRVRVRVGVRVRVRVRVRGGARVRVRGRGRGSSC